MAGAYVAADHRTDASLLYLANRLSSCQTYLQFFSTSMGPIQNKAGVKQGSISFGNQFQLVNVEELMATQLSGLGLNMGGVSVASIGVTDDVTLLTPGPHTLQSLLKISWTLTACTFMVNVWEKTKLLAYSPKYDMSATYWHEAAPLSMDGVIVPVTSQAEHVGVLRSSTGSNFLRVMKRIAPHTSSLYGIISCDKARHHCGKPAASLRVDSCSQH